MEFGVRPALLPSDIGMPDFMKWIATEFKALPEVISGANDFAATFLAESIFKLLHDFDCADHAQFREKLPLFPDASSTSHIRPNANVLAIKAKFAREFWFSSGKEVVKNIARAKHDQVDLYKTLLTFCKFTKFCCLFFLDFFLCFLYLIEEEKRGKSIAPLESSSEDEDGEGTDTDGEVTGENGGDSSDSGSDTEENSEHEEDSPKVDITG
jgi:hypothetical protein